ncbi:MAG TPA: CHY zinc finger protein [Chitinophagaceae bacterium]|nr:CHY zinc finger protein [Chitinophagaceae bacterium]
MKNGLMPQVKGKLVDDHTRCVHYHSPLDIVAIKFKCCGKYYPCYYCHKEETSHRHEVWKKSEFNTKAILCGSCNSEMTIHEYLTCNNHCPFCNAPFNPHCDKHYHLYFEA